MFRIKNVFLWLFVFTIHFAYSDTYELSTSRTSYTEHTVKGGSTGIISNTYNRGHPKRVTLNFP